MSNRLSFAHAAVRRDQHAFFAAPARGGLMARAAGWLRRLAANEAMALTPALARDLGLPMVPRGVAVDAERSRLGF